MDRQFEKDLYKCTQCVEESRGKWKNQTSLKQNEMLNYKNFRSHMNRIRCGHLRFILRLANTTSRSLNFKENKNQLLYICLHRQYPLFSDDGSYRCNTWPLT